MNETEAKLGERSHREWLEKGNSDVVDEIYAEDCVIYNRHVPDEVKRGRGGFKAYGAALFGGFPDMKINHDVVVTEDDGDYQAIIWTFEATHTGEFYGIPPTGRKVRMSGADIFHIEDGMISELYLEQNLMELFQQMGIIPTPA